MSVKYRGRPWQWHIFNPLRGNDYWAFWFGPFKIVVKDKAARSPKDDR